MIYLKQSTAITLRFGPFLDEDDGKTTEEALTISQADIRLSKAGGDFAQTNDASGATHDENGWYSLQLNTTDTGTVGALMVAIHESGALPVWREFMVLPANTYDSLVAGSDTLEVDVKAISSDETAANNLEADYDGTGYTKANSTIGTTTANTDMRGTDSALLAANITLAAGEVTVATNNDKTGYTASTVSDKTGYSLAANQSGVTIGTVTTNTDMRGTDSALTLSSSITANGATLQAVLKAVNSMAQGNFYKSSSVYTFYDDDDTGTADGTLLFTNTIDSVKRLGS